MSITSPSGLVILVSQIQGRQLRMYRSDHIAQGNLVMLRNRTNEVKYGIISDPMFTDKDCRGGGLYNVITIMDSEKLLETAAITEGGDSGAPVMHRELMTTHRHVPEDVAVYGMATGIYTTYKQSGAIDKTWTVANRLCDVLQYWDIPTLPGYQGDDQEATIFTRTD